MENWEKKLLQKIRQAIGRPDNRTNFQDLENMLGIPDAANSNVDDILRSGYDSSGQSANVNGAIIERLESLQTALNIVAAGAGGGLEDDGAPGLVTALGTTGAVVSDSATSVLGAIGANNSNNAFSSSSVVVDKDGSVLERLEGISQDLNRSEYMLGDYDDFDVADADANTERWNVGYLNGAEGGSANINTTTVGKLRVSLDPDATPTAAGYGVYLSQPIVSKYFSTFVDLDVSSFGTPNASWATLGVRISPVVYDTNNVVYAQRQESSGGVFNRIAVGAIFNGASQGEQYFTTSDTSIAFKIERFDNVWRCFYSLSQYPNFVWVLLGQYEDPSEFMDSQQSVYLDAYSPGNADAQTAIGDFDNFKLYLNIIGLSQEIAGDYDSSVVAEDGDGSVLERLEEIRGTTSTGTFTLTAAMGTAEQTITNYTPIKIGKIAVVLDVNTLITAGEGGTVVSRLKFMIDGVNLRIIDRNSFLVGTDETMPLVEGVVVEGASFVRVTIQANSAVSVNRDIIWRVIEFS